MAINDHEREYVKRRFQEATDAGTLANLGAQELDVLYPFTPGEPAVLRLSMLSGSLTQIELWACDVSTIPHQGVKVGTQDEFGRCLWEDL